MTQNFLLREKGNVNAVFFLRRAVKYSPKSYRVVKTSRSESLERAIAVVSKERRFLFYNWRHSANPLFFRPFLLDYSGMTPEERELLRRVEALAEENNDLLRKSLRRGRIGTAFRFLYWLIIAGISIATYYYVQPYITKMIPLVNTAVDEINTVKGLQKF